MKALKAYRFGVNPDDVRITCEAYRWGNAWIAWVPDDRREGGKDVLSQGNIYQMCAWLADLKRLTTNGEGIR